MKIFKNPNRGKNTHILNQESYTPEYVRLNKEPMIAQTSREEFRRAPGPKHIATPPQIKVNSGQNQEAGWMQVEQKNPVNVAPVQPIRRVLPGLKPEASRSFVNNFYDEPLESQAMPDFSSKSVEPIRENDVLMPPDEYADDSVEEIQSEGLNFSNLNVGEYILIYDNDIIASGNEEDITNLLENILMSEEYNVVEDKLAILKKMNFRTGVLISD